VGENVLGLVNWNGGMVFEEVQADLEAEGYEVQPYVLPAAAVGAPHRRDRVWFVAYSKSAGNRQQQRTNSKQPNRQSSNNGKDGDAADTSVGGMERYWREGKRRQFQTDEFDANNSQRQSRMDWSNFPTVSPIHIRDDGVPTELDGITFPKWRNESIKAGGNAVVPQVVYQIFKAIEQYGIQNPSQHKGTL